MVAASGPAPVIASEYFRLLRELGATRGEAMASSYFDSLFGTIDFQGRRVLDIGGGDGMYSYYAALRGAREVICLEPAGEGAEGWEASTFSRLRDAMPELPVRRVEQTIQSFEDAEGFDVLVSIASINHLDEDACTRLQDDPAAQEKYRRCFQHIGSLARPGARFVIADCTRHNFFNLLGMKNPLCRTIEWEKHQTPQLWADLLREAGFSAPQIRWEPIYRFGWVGRFVLSNALAAFFLKSCFRLEVAKSA